MQKVKLLSPAGYEDIAYAAFEEGADAVYIGPKGWSRRRPDREFQDDAIQRCAQYARKNKKELRLALNVFYGLIDEKMLLRKVERYVGFGIDFFIMSDIGMIKAVRKAFPKVKICASVGCGITNTESALFYKETGCNSFVAPVHLKPDEVKRIMRMAIINAEVFAHCQFDFNQCGKCWMSSFFNQKRITSEEGRPYFLGSVNRGGDCLRVCRNTWKLIGPDNKKIGDDWVRDTYYHYYVLDELKEYIGMGVEAFKLQGRNYSKELIIKMTRFFRNIIDQIYANPESFAITTGMRKEAAGIEHEREMQFQKRTSMYLEFSRKINEKQSRNNYGNFAHKRPK